MTGFSFGGLLRITRCPHCGVGRPQVSQLLDLGDRGNRRWGVFTTTCCGGVLLTIGQEGAIANNYAPIETIYPAARSAAMEIPDPARTYLQQAFETLHAPDAAAVMAGSAVDAMLKHLGLIEGSVYSRIEHAVCQHTLTAAMGDWAHEVRLGTLLHGSAGGRSQPSASTFI
jgi:hypothetical protein